MIFDDMTGRLAVWVQAPSPACHILECDELLDFLLHPDGANLGVDPVALLENLNNPFNWKYDGDGHPLSWSIQVGFTSLWVFRTSPMPTLLVEKCVYCGIAHPKGPGTCAIAADDHLNFGGT